MSEFSLNGDVKVMFVFGAYFGALAFLAYKQPDGWAARHAKDLFGIGIIAGALVFIAIELKGKVSSDAIIGVVGTIAGLYFGSTIRGSDKKRLREDREQ